MNKKLIKVSNALLLTEFKHIFRVMKLTSLFGVLCVSSAFAINVNSQSLRVNIHANQKQAKEVIKQIEEQTDYLFVYNHDKVNLNNTVTIQANNETVAEVLNQMFAGTDIIYAMQGNNILLMQKDAVVQQSGKVVIGTIVDPSGMPVIGANVMVKGTTNGTITDMDGKFSLEVEEGATLQISYIGYANQEIKVGNQKTLSIALKEDAEALDELVVVGYGVQNKQAITGAVIKADIDTYRDVTSNNIMDMIKGSVPGLNIGGTNTAGAVPDFSIRGQNSTSGNSPLVVLDGAIYDGSLGDIPSEDIENLTVLKDASAAAVYGSRSANGVILITTRRGRSNTNKPEFNVNLSYGISHELNRIDVYDAEGYIQKLIDIRAMRGLDTNKNDITLYLTDVEAKNYNATPDHRPTLVDPYELIRQNAYNLKANVSISNSSELASYYISTSLTDQKGVILNDRYKNFSGRINIDSNLASWLKVGVKANYSIRDYSGSSPNIDEATKLSPYASIWDEQGNYLKEPNGAVGTSSPFWMMKTDDLEKYNVLGAVLNTKISIPWVQGLSYELIYSNNLRWTQKNYFYGKNTVAGESKNGIGERMNENNYHMLLDNMIKYNNTFKDLHNIDVTLLYSREHRTWNSMKTYAENFDNTVLGDNKLEDGKKQLVDTGEGESGAIGMMARASYTFDNRYSVTGTVRRDGCSSFSVNKKWATFASAGLNWNISKEKFLESVVFLDDLNIRFSYGTNGNQTISPYTTLAKVGTGKYIFAGDPSYSITQYISSFALDNLGWETTTGANWGLDFSLFNNRFSGSIDTYLTNTSDLLFPLAMPTVSGMSSITSNLGKIRNKGVELNLHSVNVANENFTWSTDFAFSLNRNKVVTIYGEDNDGDGKEDDLVSSGYFIGKPLGTIYTYKVIGMWQQEDLDNGTIMEGMRPGDYKLEDVNGDGKIDSENDRQFLGTSNENFRWSMTNTLTYKDWSLMIYINSVWGGNGYFLSGSNTPYYDSYTDRTDMNRTVFDYWTPENTEAKYPRLDYQYQARYRGTKYQDRSFIKLQKIALTYDLSRFVKRIGLGNLRLSLSADNLLTFSPHWDGLDPETDQGLTQLARPSIRTYQFNLMFNF